MSKIIAVLISTPFYLIINIPSALVLRLIVEQHFMQEIPALGLIPFVDYLAIILVVDLLRSVSVEKAQQSYDKALVNLAYEAMKLFIVFFAVLILGQFV